MKKQIVNFLSLAMIIAAPSFLMTSCTSDPCKDVTCENAGVATEDGENCSCVCAAGYEGTSCETLSRVKFLSSYSVSDACSASGAVTYSVTISASSTEETKVLISNFWDNFTNPVVASVDGNAITIASQTPDNDGFAVSGNGTINGNVITLNYSVVDNSNGDSDVCNGTFTKQ